ncbi:hypothetical protein BH24CHL5_BH24CHL5_05350 [soil metagenome]
MDFTTSYASLLPSIARDCYDWREVRNAAAVLQSTNPAAFVDLVAILTEFRLLATDITDPGGSESAVPHRLNAAFRDRGWREGMFMSRQSSTLTLLPYESARETDPRLIDRESESESYKIDNIKDRVALDIEWHAKDGNLDRDVAAYRSLYEATIIDAAVVVTRHHRSIRALSVRLGRAEGFKTTTTTNLEKLEPRLRRGDGGGCQILAVAITDRCYAP